MPPPNSSTPSPSKSADPTTQSSYDLIAMMKCARPERQTGSAQIKTNLSVAERTATLHEVLTEVLAILDDEEDLW